MFKVLKIDGLNLMTDRGGISVSPFSYADGGKTKPVPAETAIDMRNLFIRSPALLKLYYIFVTMREEQISIGLGLGKTPEEKKQRNQFYAAQVLKEARKIDDVISEIDEVDALIGGRLESRKMGPGEIMELIRTAQFHMQVLPRNGYLNNDDSIEEARRRLESSLPQLANYQEAYAASQKKE